MLKRRALIIGRFFARLIGLGAAIVFIIFLCLVNYDDSISRHNIELNDVKYGTINDAKLHPNTLYIETKPGYSCTYKKNDDGKIVLELDFGYATIKDPDGIKLHFYMDNIYHTKSEFETVFYNDATDEEKIKIDNAIENDLRVNFVSKIVIDYGYYNESSPTRITINDKHYSFVTKEGEIRPAQVDPIHSEKLDDDDYGYDSVNPKEGYLCTIALGARTDLMLEEETVIGNSSVIIDGYLETSLDYDKMGIKYSILDANPNSLTQIIIREVKEMNIFIIILIILIGTSVWAIPGVVVDIFKMSRDGFHTLKTEGLGRVVSITVTKDRDGSEDYSPNYENDGLFIASVFIFCMIPFAPAFAIIKSTLSIFTDIWFFIFE